jgi:DNA-binding protein H-NS
MASLQDLLAQKEALEKKISEVQREERSAAINKVRALMAEYGLTAADLTGKSTPAKTQAGPRGKVAVKYRNAATGDTWTGRGLQPKWLRAELAAGRKLADFAV